MKVGELTSLGHDIADSLASGVGSMIGVAMTDIFFEASSSGSGFIAVDFLNGTSTGGDASPGWRHAIALYRDALPELCKKHGFEVSAIAELTARFGVDDVRGPNFTVTVRAVDGRRSSDQYVGIPGRRLTHRRSASTEKGKN